VRRGARFKGSVSGQEKGGDYEKTTVWEKFLGTWGVDWRTCNEMRTARCKTSILGRAREGSKQGRRGRHNCIKKKVGHF